MRKEPGARFVLTNLILSELVTRLLVRAGALQAAAAGRSLLDSRRYNVLFADATLVRSGLARMEQYEDPSPSTAISATAATAPGRDFGRLHNVFTISTETLAWRWT